MEVYEPGDKVYLFGFSRGAFTARALAGALNSIGLLHPDHDNQLEYAMKYYLDRKYASIRSDYKAKFCRPCPVHFIGVWDTVVATALVENQKFKDTNLNPEVKFGYHAMAIDERRRDFPVTPWNEKTLARGQTVEQVWFAGVHSDVGGWYDSRALSSIALCWMIDKAVAAGLKIDKNLFKQVQQQRNPLGRQHDSLKGFWHFRGSRARKIPPGAKIHQSVIDRINGVTKYKPDLPRRPKVVT